MKQDIQRIMLAAAKPLFLIFILYMLKIVEVGMSWEGHLSGGIMGTLCALAFINHGPQRPEPFANEEDELLDYAKK